MDRVGVEPTTFAMLSIVELHKTGSRRLWHDHYFSSQHILNPFIVLVSSLLQITVTRTEVGRAGFIINQFQIRDIQTQEIGGKRRA
jgi:hypothetical protein